jgi:DNA-binding MarR family transcriptional regulator
LELSKVKALKILVKGSLTIRELASGMELSYPRAAAIVRELEGEGYCEKSRGRVVMAPNVKGSLLKVLADRYDLESLFGGSSERVLLALSKPSSVEELRRKTGLAQSTTYQTLRRLTTLGVVRRIDDIYALAEDQDLKTFLDLQERERKAAGIEPYAILIRSNGFKLKKVPAGKQARGSLTAFSLFGRYGVDYESPHDYYIEPQKEVSIEEVLVHALAASESKAEGTMCAVFYMKNFDRIDPTKVKPLARKFGVPSLWVDLQNYIRGLQVLNAEAFLPWDEFVDKASLYGVPVSLPPEAEKGLAVIRKLGEKLNTTIHAYLFGGANLLLRGLKKATKDLDVVLKDERDFSKLQSALLALGFRPLGEMKLTPSDRKLNPSGIYVAEGMPRFDLFTKVICNALFLTDEMKSRAETIEFGKLVLHLLSLEDVFLLKSITEREGDLEDMATIVRRGGGLKWGEILRTYLAEENEVRKHFCFTILDNIELLQQREGINIPLHGLLRHCIDIGVLQALAHGKTNVKGIRELIDFPEHAIRNRVEKLTRDGKILKSRRGGCMVLTLTNRGKASLFQ